MTTELEAGVWSVDLTSDASVILCACDDNNVRALTKDAPKPEPKKNKKGGKK